MDLLELADAAMRARSHELEEQTDTSKVGVEGEEHNEDLGDAASEQQPQQDSRRRSTRQRTSVATRAPLLRTRRGQPMAVASTSELPGAPTQNRGGGDHEENVKGNTREGQEGEGSGVGVTSNAALVSTSSATELDAASALQAFTSDTPRSGASSTDNVDALPEGGNGKEPARGATAISICICLTSLTDVQLLLLPSRHQSGDRPLSRPAPKKRLSAHLVSHP